MFKLSAELEALEREREADLKRAGKPLPRFLDTKNNPYEKTIEKKVCDYAAKHGIAHRKYKNPERRGAPDRILFPLRRPGTCFFIEFKSKGGRLSETQREEIRQLTSIGMLVFVIDNVEQGKMLIDIMC